MRGFGYSFLTLNNIKGGSFTYLSDLANSLNNSSPVKLITSITDIRALLGVTFTSDHPHNTLTFTNCSNITNCTLPKTVVNGLGTKLNFSGCAIANYSNAGYLGVTSASASHFTKLNDCVVSGTYTLTGVESLQGITYSASPVLPSPPSLSTPAPAQPYSSGWQSEVSAWQTEVQQSRQQLMGTQLMQ